MQNRLDLKPLVEAAIKDFGLPANIVRIVEVVGSSYIEGIDTSDVDILVLCTDVETLIDVVMGERWQLGGSASSTGDPRFSSYKTEIEGRVCNILLTTSMSFFHSWASAAAFCQAMHRFDPVREKQDRIAIHDAYMGKP
jgi:hypothetical protein